MNPLCYEPDSAMSSLQNRPLLSNRHPNGADQRRRTFRHFSIKRRPVFRSCSYIALGSYTDKVLRVQMRRAQILLENRHSREGVFLLNRFNVSSSFFTLCKKRQLAASTNSQFAKLRILARTGGSSTALIRSVSLTSGRLRTVSTLVSLPGAPNIVGQSAIPGRETGNFLCHFRNEWGFSQTSSAVIRGSSPRGPTVISLFQTYFARATAALMLF